jgi:hypothetical protein
VPCPARRTFRRREGRRSSILPCGTDRSRPDTPRTSFGRIIPSLEGSFAVTTMTTTRTCYNGSHDTFTKHTLRSARSLKPSSRPTLFFCVIVLSPCECPGLRASGGWLTTSASEGFFGFDIYYDFCIGQDGSHTRYFFLSSSLCSPPALVIIPASRNWALCLS